MNRWILLLLPLCWLAGCTSRPTSAPERPPNIVLIFCDDLGYGDIGCFGSSNPTPNIDRMAREGVRFTDFYVGQAVCSASRAALLTGCYPGRVGIQGALGPRSKIGLNPAETTLAEVLKSRGYATAIYGKWHLGDAPEFLPTRQGFDEWYGLPYSNDMWPNHPTDKSYPPLPLYVNETVVQLMPDQSQLTRQYTDRAVRFIERNREKPFFLYLPHSMPHVPLFVSRPFEGRTGQGLYADVVAEIDDSVGQILAALAKHGLDENTLVVFTSDNGPWQVFGNHAGQTGGLRESKGTAFDGGSRVPFVARWPKNIPAGKTRKDVAGTIDLLPTFARLAGADVPSDRIIDGRDIWPLLADHSGAKAPREFQAIYYGRHLDAIRSGDWKLHLAHDYRTTARAGMDGAMGSYGKAHIPVSLFHMVDDPNETTDVSARHPAVRDRLLRLAETVRQDLGDTQPDRPGQGVRPPGRVP